MKTKNVLTGIFPNKTIYSKKNNNKSNINNLQPISYYYNKFINKKNTVKKTDVLKEFFNKAEITYKKRGFYRASFSSKQAITSYETAKSYNNNNFSITKKIIDLKIPYDEL